MIASSQVLAISLVKWNCPDSLWTRSLWPREHCNASADCACAWISRYTSHIQIAPPCRTRVFYAVAGRWFFGTASRRCHTDMFGCWRIAGELLKANIRWLDWCLLERWLPLVKDNRTRRQYVVRKFVTAHIKERTRKVSIEIVSIEYKLFNIYILRQQDGTSYWLMHYLQNYEHYIFFNGNYLKIYIKINSWFLEKVVNLYILPIFNQY